MIKIVLFLSAVLMELFYILMFLRTINSSTFRFWPPPSQHSWQFFTSWIVAFLVAVNFFFLGLLDFDSFLFHNWFRIPIALTIFFFASIIGTWSFLHFGLRTTLGLETRLITDGPYRYSRNPQYVGDILNIIAYMVLTNSWMVWVIGTLGITLNVIAPFTEESWLEERYGAEYLAYRERVPRFIGFRKKDGAL
jgi:protein-S-isoprenylcysteine O-methyltransferase Ste14